MVQVEPAELANVLHAAQILVNHAKRIGVVLTIEQVPETPLAMGRHKTVVHVRPVRKAD